MGVALDEKLFHSSLNVADKDPAKAAKGGLSGEFALMMTPIRHDLKVTLNTGIQQAYASNVGRGQRAQRRAARSCSSSTSPRTSGSRWP